MSSARRQVKVLGRGEVGKALTVRAHKFSGKAAEKIAAAGGTTELIVNCRMQNCRIAAERECIRRSASGSQTMDSLKNIFTISDLRNRVLFTLGMLAVFRLGGFIPTPGINAAALDELARQTANTMFGLYDMFTGGNLSNVTIFALGIMPYISASIILQLLTVVWPYLEKIKNEGELGRRKITQYTRYGTILLSVVQALGIAIFLERQTDIAGGLPLVYNPGWGFRLMTVLTLTTGTCFIMWLGEQITERGIGNGMSLIIYAGIVVGLPRAVIQTFDQMRTGPDRPDPHPVPADPDGVRHRGDRVRRARPSSRDGAVRQARRRPADVRRVEHAHPAQGQHRGRHPGDLRVVDSGLSGDDRVGVPGPSLGGRDHDAARPQYAALQPAVRDGDHLLHVLLHRDHLQSR